MIKPLIVIISKIRHKLTTMSEYLHMLYDTHKDNLENVPQLIKFLDYTIQNIQTTKIIKTMK